MKESQVFQLFARAKINRLLRVLRKRQDGYRELRLEFFPIALADEVLAVPDPLGNVEFYQPKAGLIFFEDYNQFEFRTDIPTVNTVSRAIELFEQATGQKSEYSFKVLKNIPDGAGLGGGSSDAAACLLFLNEYYGLPLQRERLIKLALEVGSDVPFFLDQVPGVYSGRGEELEKKISYPSMDIGLVCPDFSISTAEAFARLPGDTCGKDEDLDPGRPFFSYPAEVNAFWHARHPNFEKLARIRSGLIYHGTNAVYMSGSGSVMYFPMTKSFDQDGFLNENLNTKLISTKTIA